MDDLDEKVLTIQQRQKRAQIMRRIQPKIERAREIAQKRMAPEASIRKRAFIQARQLVRRRVAGERGAEYEKLGPSEKMAIDRAVEGKQKIIKAIALRLIPRVKRAEAIRLSTFMKGQALQNQGQPEGKSKESSGSSSVKENLNALFSEAFPEADTDTVNMKAGTKFASKDKKIDAKDKSKNSAIIQYSKFQEEVDYVTPAFISLCKKSEKSGIDLDVLGEVYNRGWNTWTEGCSVSQQQYAFARVNSFINQGKTYFNEDSDLQEARAPGKPSITRYKRPDGTTALKSLNKWGKRKDWQDTEGGLKKAREHSKSDLSEVQHTNENFIDGKGPGKPGDASRHGLKGKSATELRKIRSSETASPRKKQLAHWMLNMHHNEEVTLKEGIGSADPDYHVKVHQDLQWHAGRNRSGSMGAANYHHLMSLDDQSHIENYYEKTVHPILKKHKYPTPPVGPGDGGNPKYHAAVQEIIKNWRNEPRWMHNEETELEEKRGLWDNIHAKRKRIKAGSGERMRKPGTEGAPTDQDFKNAQESVSEGLWANINAKRKRIKTGSNERMRPPGTIPAHVFKDASGTGPMKESYESKNSKIRKKIETVDRAPPHTEHSKQAQIQKKIIDEEGNSQPDPKKRLIGTDTLVKALKKDTPGEGKNINEAFAMTFSEATRKTTPSIRNTKKLIQRLHDKEQGQTYAGAPYSSHPKAVMRLGIKVFGGDRFGQQARKAALLHDTIEDTPTSPATLLKKGFHPDVVNAVSLLSKDKTKSYEENIAHIASGNTPAHKIAQMVKYVDNMSNYMAPPKPEWEQKRVEKQKDKYMQSMKKLGGVLGVDHHENLQPSWKTKSEGKNINESFSIAFASGVGVTLTAADLGMRAQGGFELHPSVIKQMEDMEEEVRSSDTEGVVVHTPTGKTIVRKQKVNHKIIGTGNLTDGKPDDTV
jgi:hypothetical protein